MNTWDNTTDIETLRRILRRQSERIDELDRRLTDRDDDLERRLAQVEQRSLETENRVADHWHPDA